MRKISVVIQLTIAYILGILVFTLSAIFSRRIESSYILLIILFIALFTGLTYLTYTLLHVPMNEAIRIIKHFNDNQYNYKMECKMNKESYDLANNINILGNKALQKETLLKEKTTESTNYYSQYLYDLEAKKQLVASISHEIKTPLAVIEAIANAILDDIITGDEIKKEVQNIIDEASKTNAMLKEIVSLYKVDSNLIEFKLKEANLQDLLNDILVDLNGIKTKYNQTILFIGDFNKNIIVNEPQFKRALRNIILNALIYSPTNNLIEVVFENRDDYSIFKVINYNSNIEPNDLKHIFEPFYRGDKSRTKKDDIGNGLGLYLVKEILDKHHFDFGIKNIKNAVEFYIIIK